MDKKAHVILEDRLDVVTSEQTNFMLVTRKMFVWQVTVLIQVEDSTLTDNLIKQKYLLDVSQKNLIKCSKDQVQHLKKGYLIRSFWFCSFENMACHRPCWLKSKRSLLIMYLQQLGSEDRWTIISFVRSFLGNGVGDSPAVALKISWLTARICSLSHLMFAIAIGKNTTMSCHRSPNFANTTSNQVYVTWIRYHKKKLTLLHLSILYTVLT